MTLEPIPLLDLKAQHRAIKTEVLVAVHRVVESQWFILGPEVVDLEQAIAAFCGCRHAIGVSSGSDALLVSLMALGVDRDDEVIVPSFTFFATAGAVARLGARPVFVDVDPLSFNLDPDQLQDAITERTRAIIPVHLFGQVADMSEILDVAERNDLAVIEDAAQALGATYRGRHAGALGELGCFSFFPSKNLGGMGDGGMVVTNDDNLASQVRLLRNHGFRPKYYNRVVGGNFRLDAIQAAVLRVKLGYLDSWAQARCQNAGRYRELFQQAGLEGHGVVLPRALDARDHVFNQYVIRARDRDRLRSYLVERKIGTEIYYPVPLHRQECFAKIVEAGRGFPVSEKAASEVLALPIYPELGHERQERVVEAIRDFYRQERGADDA